MSIYVYGIVFCWALLTLFLIKMFYDYAMEYINKNNNKLLKPIPVITNIKYN
jgi:hypothetical protein